MVNLLSLRRRLMHIESQLPQLGNIEDSARFRLDVHLHLFYWHARLYLGRPFLLEHTSAENTTPCTDQNAPAGTRFALDAVDAALAIIQLCYLIHDKIGLSRASYVTEFTSCRAAMLVLIAKGITDKSDITRRALEEGLDLLEHMSVGQGKASSETRVIATLQRAITRLHRRHDKSRNGPNAQHESNECFKEWTMLWQQQSPEPDAAVFAPPAGSVRDMQANEQAGLAHNVTHTHVTPPDEVDADDTWNVLFNTQLDEFNLFPFESYSNEAEFGSFI